MSWVTAERINVSLPGGFITTDGQWLREAALGPLTGHQEDWLVRNTDAPSAVSVSSLLRGCLLSLDEQPVTPDIVDQLLVGDRDYLVLQLRRATLGEQFFAVVDCPACGEKLDASFRATDVPVTQPPFTAGSYTTGIGDSDRRRTVTYRLPTGADQRAVLALEPQHAGEALLDRCLLHDGGLPLSPEERLHVAQAIEEHAPRLDLELELLCPACEHAFLLPFDTTAFFLDELRSNDRNLLREFHSLAFHYHWGHAEILDLTRVRRRTYLALLNEELSRN